MVGLLGLLAEEGDEVVAVLGLLQTAESHLGAGNVLLGVLEVLELDRMSAFDSSISYGASPGVLVAVANMGILTRVSSFQVMPLPLLASE